MDVVVTGAKGFLGRHFVRALETRGDYAMAIDLPESPDDRDALEFFRTDPYDWDLIIHCAAVAPHRQAIDGRALAVGAGNLELDAAMFGWAARCNPGRVAYLSSSAAYPVGLQDGNLIGGLAEDDLRMVEVGEPDAIYGWVKVTGERLAAAYRAQGGAVTVVRPFSGYGEDQAALFPFGAFRDRARRRENPFTVWGDGTQVRDWIHVDDVVAGTLALLDAEVDGPVNLCTGRGTSMAELAGLFAREAGYEPRMKFLADKPSGVAHRVGDPTRLHEFYRPRITVEEGVRRALALEVAR
jgi:nucleoside-diphosphate-sugar epimerase